MTTEPQIFDIDLLPELPTIVGMAGATRRAEVGGSGCNDTGILVATIVYGITDA